MDYYDKFAKRNSIGAGLSAQRHCQNFSLQLLAVEPYSITSPMGFVLGFVVSRLH
jgi:hypothetical protein